MCGVVLCWHSDIHKLQSLEKFQKVMAMSSKERVMTWFINHACYRIATCVVACVWPGLTVHHHMDARRHVSLVLRAVAAYLGESSKIFFRTANVECCQHLLVRIMAALSSDTNCDSTCSTEDNLIYQSAGPCSKYVHRSALPLAGRSWKSFRAKQRISDMFLQQLLGAIFKKYNRVKIRSLW